MKAIDIINPKPKTYLGKLLRWADWIIVKTTTDFKLGRKIEVEYIPTELKANYFHTAYKDDKIVEYGLQFDPFKDYEN